MNTNKIEAKHAWGTLIRWERNLSPRKAGSTLKELYMELSRSPKRRGFRNLSQEFIALRRAAINETAYRGYILPVCIEGNLTFLPGYFGLSIADTKKILEFDP